MSGVPASTYSQRLQISGRERGLFHTSAHHHRRLTKSGGTGSASEHGQVDAGRHHNHTPV